MDVVSSIVVSPIDGALTFNDNHTEMIVGKVPNKVKFDATNVFRDLSLTDYKVLWYVSDMS
ncbi:TPA: hypothetical protein DEP21_04150 [Patescibacteria group bacterium]|nr:hypothetical protein [Candidatus Gracilibacteria bacterium]